MLESSALGWLVFWQVRFRDRRVVLRSSDQLWTGHSVDMCSCVVVNVQLCGTRSMVRIAGDCKRKVVGEAVLRAAVYYCALCCGGRARAGVLLAVFRGCRGRGALH
jgi:hypothetical protein